MIRDKPNGTQPAPDKIEKAPSGALSPELASDKKREEAPLSGEETKSPSKDKDVPSQQEHIDNLEVVTMHSQGQCKTQISLEEDKTDSTLPPYDKRAQDKVEEEREDNIPPPHSSKRTLKIRMKDGGKAALTPKPWQR